MEKLTQEFLVAETKEKLMDIYKAVLTPILKEEGLSIEDALNEPALKLNETISVAALAVSTNLTLDLICEKLKITEADGKDVINKNYDKLLKSVQTSIKL